MNYKQKLISAAKYVFEGDSGAAEEARIDPADIGITAELKPHQVEGVSWLIRRYRIGVNSILGDEMGLGKTLQAIFLLSYLKIHLRSPGPFLVLCPLSVIDGWESEVGNFAPEMRLLRYVGEKECRRQMRLDMHKYVKEQSLSSHAPTFPFDVLLTTFDIALIDQDFLCQFPWYYAIIDEAQRLKNPSSWPMPDLVTYHLIYLDTCAKNGAQVLYNVLSKKFAMPRKLLMTGTPIQNNLTELWALMHFCMPLVFGTLEQFLSVFAEARDPSFQDADKVKEQFKILRYVLGSFMLRRTKAKLVESGILSLPPVTEITVRAPLSSLQKKIYASILKKELPKLVTLASGTSSALSLNNIVIQLRKACSHPYLFPGIEPEPYQEGEHLVQASGKLLILDQLLQKLHDSGNRILLFAQMTHTLDILQDFLELRKYTYERLDGSVRAEERFSAIRSFSQNLLTRGDDPDANLSTPFVFLISTRAGGVGLNLVAADTVIFYEQDWNPQVDKQALQRAHRIGQRKHVLSINLVTGHTIEEVIMRRSQRKLQLSHNIMGDDASNTEGHEVGDLKSVIFGLHVFDITEMNSEKSNDQLDKAKVADLAEKVIASRHELQLGLDDRKFEINPGEIHDFKPDLDEASYMTWVEKFKQATVADDTASLEAGSRRNLPDERHVKAKAAHQKAEEKKLSKWEALGYRSLSVSNPVDPGDQDLMSASGAVHFVYGDCTNTITVCPSEPTIIFSCVDNSGNWGHGGLFDALARISAIVPYAYERAAEFNDLHLGDLHLIEITEEHHELNNHGHTRQWVALAVVQSYNPRRKVPRSGVSIADLELCLAKASFSAAQFSGGVASIHMPRISYQNGSDRSEWYTVERLLRKYAAMYGINIYVYYFRRSCEPSGH